MIGRTNISGGGGSSLKDTDAILNVTVPTGSTVTMTKGGVTLTPTIWTTNADNTLDCALFSVPASTFDSNAWTVTGSLDGQGATNTIVIDSNEEYEMTLEYDFVLYDNGTEYVTITSNPTGGATTNKYSTYIEGKTNGTSGAVRIYPLNAIALAEYSAVKCQIDIVSYSGSPTIALSVRASAGSGATASVSYTNRTGSQTATLDISNQTGSFIPMLTASGNIATIQMYKMWLMR